MSGKRTVRALALTGAGAAGAAATGAPHFMQNFNPVLSPVPHFEQDRPAGAGAAAGGGTGAGGRGVVSGSLTVAAGIADAAATGAPHFVQNFNPALNPAPHLAHVGPADAGGGVSGKRTVGAVGFAAGDAALAPDQHDSPGAGAAGGADSGNFTVGAAGSIAGAGAAGRPITGVPHFMQNFSPGASTAPHF